MKWLRAWTPLEIAFTVSIALHADELVVMTQGRTVHQGACADPATHRRVEQAFDHRIAIHPLQGQWVALPIY